MEPQKKEKMEEIEYVAYLEAGIIPTIAICTNKEEAELFKEYLQERTRRCVEEIKRYARKRREKNDTD